jgi:hypothetical protein
MNTRTNVRKAIDPATCPKRWLMPREVAELCGTSESNVTKAVRFGWLPARFTSTGHNMARHIWWEDAVRWSGAAHRGKEKIKRVFPRSAGEGEEWSIGDVVRETGLTRQAVHYAIKDGRLAALALPWGKKTLWRVRPAAVRATWPDRL